jgi:hypothetical protein
MCLYWNENFDYALMKILKIIGILHWSMLFHCSTFTVIQILPNKLIKICIQNLNLFLKMTKMFISMKMFNMFISISLTKVF